MITISATNRGSKRVEADFYATPIHVVEKFLKNHQLNLHKPLLECSAGNGNIIKTIDKQFYTTRIDSVEIRKEEETKLNEFCDNVYIQDFLSFVPDCNYGTIISNPPFSIAQEIIEHCFDISSLNTEIIMLLRLAFLESKKRYDFWQKHPVSKLYILSERPSFTGKGTDATAYAWFVWDNDNSQSIKVI